MWWLYHGLWSVSEGTGSKWFLVKSMQCWEIYVMYLSEHLLNHHIRDLVSVSKLHPIIKLYFSKLILICFKMSDKLFKRGVNKYLRLVGPPVSLVTHALSSFCSKKADNMKMSEHGFLPTIFYLQNQLSSRSDGTCL